MNIDDAYDKDLLFVFPWSLNCGQQRTIVMEDEKEKEILIYYNIRHGPQTTFCPLFMSLLMIVKIS